MLHLTALHLEQLHQHALKCYPEECCGLLLGKSLGDSAQVTEIWLTPNSWTPDFLASPPIENNPDPENVVSEASRLNHFAIAPIELLRAQKYARSKASDIVGIYHSHPNHPAVPSEYDRRIAWSQYSYLIMAVVGDQITKTRSWKLSGDRQFLEELVTITH
ncbi:M67 family metallopeptidase [[Limnothrix rosea] IAM M-220]|uniref:M67 family metallopeptidase n=1 Tax=[Limnothrix rosea] IAM M-220 TaxID=454133 RepID=UPI0009635A5C|nr:M67 family metallopeptidase [[Limnothrix rosea] IAM M-220]OKH18284.1 hypothetical protein NIES208_06035 [[Limnothrix rosea] IAM M-220]